ncbi:Uncharacterised protein [Mycobacteroides abscessus]|nr:Uncharacterised protein [Mycobacteroides abscessus]
MRPPSLKTGWLNRLVVTISMTRPVSSAAWRTASRRLVRSASSAPKGTTSSSWNVKPHAPRSARRRTDSAGSSAGRLALPNWSCAVQPTVHRPKEKLMSWVVSSATVVSSSRGPERRRSTPAYLCRTAELIRPGR